MNFSCGFKNRVNLSLLLGFLLTGKMLAQDTIALKNIDIIAKKYELSQLGKKSETIDSISKQQFRFSSIADLLAFNSPVFVKSYGPGALSTSSFRGGNASQTAILWNGFNLQNAMLGQSDLALMPSVFFDDITVEYGGSSSLWGSGAVGGSIRLDNKNPFNKGLVTTSNLGSGSFGYRNGSTNILFSKQRFVSSTRIYGIRSENNFNYRDTTDKEKTLKSQQHADYDFKGLMQELKFILNPKQMLSLNAWISDNHRSLPAVNPAASSKTNQKDAALRFTANWTYDQAIFKSMIRAAWFYDKINYTDSLLSVFSKNKVQTVMAENENFFHWGKCHLLNIGVNFSSSSALASNYEGHRSASRLSFLVGNKSLFFNNRLSTYFSARAEYFSAGNLPLTGNLATEVILSKHFTAKINTARVYRQPTLNDLYWMPGGNPQLKPEEGYTVEGELKYKKEVRSMLFLISGAAYSRAIENWILWIPGVNAAPSPKNVQHVWSRGTETNCKVIYSKDQLKISVNLITAYVLSTVTSDSQENNNTRYKQLIYTPRYTVNANTAISYARIGIFFFHQYVGYRFTTSDNSEWLVPYQVSSLKLNYVIPYKKLHLSLFASCNNLGNNSYNIIASRPMPLRNYEIGITLQTRNK